ncbi:hypothetical protein IWQ60_006832 [Tieghemiomyces parasiticus]|uniref:Uncharacterized protein n=1 Tax=Tieghemiomyces parasiticus TaxID=78921 RepID=A0A9W8A638_9FUNG|nr:hypothetical protein IWQ60_006832 [Tieghemiomyces parasiticus]
MRLYRLAAVAHSLLWPSHTTATSPGSFATGFACVLPFAVLYIPLYLQLLVQHTATMCSDLRLPIGEAGQMWLCETAPAAALRGIARLEGPSTTTTHSAVGRTNVQAEYYERPSFIGWLDHGLATVGSGLGTGLRLLTRSAGEGIRDPACVAYLSADDGRHLDAVTTGPPAWLGYLQYSACVAGSAGRQLLRRASRPELVRPPVPPPRPAHTPEIPYLNTVNLPSLDLVGLVRQTILGYVALNLWSWLTLDRLARAYAVPYVAPRLLTGGVCAASQLPDPWLTALTDGSPAWTARCHVLQDAVTRSDDALAARCPDLSQPWTALLAATVAGPHLPVCPRGVGSVLGRLANSACRTLLPEPAPTFDPLLTRLPLADRLWLDGLFRRLQAFLNLGTLGLIAYQVTRAWYAVLHWIRNFFLRCGRRLLWVALSFALTAYYFEKSRRQYWPEEA